MCTFHMRSSTLKCCCTRTRHGCGHMLNCSCSSVTQHSVPRSAHTHLRTHIAGRTSRARSQYRRPIDCLPLLLAGTATSTKRRGESVSQKASVGMLTKADSLSGCESVRGPVMISSRGSWKAFSIWFVKVPAAHTREFACSCYVQNTGMHHTSMPSLSLSTVGKCLWNTGRVAAGHVVCTGVLPELEHSALAVGTSRDDAHWQHRGDTRGCRNSGHRQCSCAFPPHA